MNSPRTDSSSIKYNLTASSSTKAMQRIERLGPLFFKSLRFMSQLTDASGEDSKDANG